LPRECEGYNTNPMTPKGKGNPVEIEIQSQEGVSAKTNKYLGEGKRGKGVDRMEGNMLCYGVEILKNEKPDW